MHRRICNNNLSALEKNCDVLRTKIANFRLISDILQDKTYQLLNIIRKKEDFFGIFTREYDEVSNDINSVQAVIEMYSTELEELETEIEECKREHSAADAPRGKNDINQPNNGDSTILSPQQRRLPMHKCQLRAHLPANQFTIVEVRPGQTIREVLEKKLSHRCYRTEDLSVYSVGSGNLVSWDADAAGVALVSGDLVVKFNDEQTHRRPKHEFQRRRFFETQVCSICQKFVFFGISCKICGLAFHQRCVSRLEKHYLQPTEEDNVIEIQRLLKCSGQRSSNWLAVQNGSSGTISTSGLTTATTAQVCVYEAATVAAAVAAAAAGQGGGKGEQRGGGSEADRGVRDGAAVGTPSTHLLTAVTRERSSSSPNVCHHINPQQLPSSSNRIAWVGLLKPHDSNQPSSSSNAAVGGGGGGGGGGDSSECKGHLSPNLETEDRSKSSTERGDGSGSTSRQRQVMSIPLLCY
ncbi:unnamed protein product [Taenia asiatica]|uniref:Serine/threonine-protein kinase B-raf n=1 Tax=Taenia asiatica TaxID=60517 RepID=A0A0R3VYI4_TAEAS|nr:unnamed protein product [Taenia asiatica]